MRLVKQFAVVVLISLLGSQLITAANWNTPLTLLLGFATAALALLGYRWVVRRTERREVAELNWRGAAAAVGRGLLIGLVMFTAVILNLALLGDYHVAGFGSLTGAIALFGFTAAAAVTEELLYRGVLLRIIEGRLGSYGALGLTAGLFGLSHLLNPHATLWGAIAIAIEAGGMLGAAYIATRNLWVPIGMHFAWNYAEGGIFGTQISGKAAPEGLLDGVLSGPAALTGGEFGPEASVYSVAAGLIVTIAFIWLAKRRGQLLAPRRRTATLVP
ncbi:CPBP family intramembrane metalloprotease [Kribbella antibiotica]|uniref:CPBP family intramembrane metalloprotease n=1 Tax=Kribbella antibiotica TaxID=190195 RepID=A0A4R4ZLM5_9ACTN|nr:CPBP family intramembrane glutamic endopeptidase [Kribbella antibiotica]TDD57722.1 CPBP family intramembrane metalloprotease [Kribbella antibiotica]